MLLDNKMSFDPQSYEKSRQNPESKSYCSVQDGIDALGKAHIYGYALGKVSPNVAFETVPMFV